MELHNVSLGNYSVQIGNVTVKDFMDEGNPVEMTDCEIANIEWSCNGRMIRTIKPAAVLISVTVIPGSDSDDGLYDLWKDNFSNGGDVKNPDQVLTANLKFGDNGSVSLTNGTCISGPAGYSSSGPAKMGGNTYTFAFEKHGD